MSDTPGKGLEGGLLSFSAVDLRRLLAFMRMAVGVMSWTAPATSVRAFGLGSVAEDPRVAFITRLFGSRDLALGGALWIAEDDAVVRRAVQLGLVTDLVDVVAAGLSIRRGGSRLGALLAGGGAAFFAGMGVTILLAPPEATGEAARAGMD